MTVDLCSYVQYLSHFEKFSLVYTNIYREMYRVFPKQGDHELVDLTGRRLLGEHQPLGHRDRGLVSAGGRVSAHCRTPRVVGLIPVDQHLGEVPCVLVVADRHIQRRVNGHVYRRVHGRINPVVLTVRLLK